MIQFKETHDLFFYDPEGITSVQWSSFAPVVLFPIPRFVVPYALIVKSIPNGTETRFLR